MKNEIKKEEKVKNILKKLWDLTWRDESLKGWIISIIVIFVFVKFIFFPTLSFLTGTAIPIAIVESCSMYHENELLSLNDFDNWWERHENKYQKYGIEKEEFEEFKIKKGFDKGDILFITGTNPEDIEIGNIIIFKGNRKNPVIHRVVEIKKENGERVFSTVGDNNKNQLNFEKEITEEQIVGKAQFRLIPYVGWIKLIFIEPFREENGKGFCQETE